MLALFNFSRYVERLLGNKGLAFVAAAVLVISLLGVANQAGSSGSDLGTATTLPPVVTSSSVAALTSSTTAMSTTTALSTTTAAPSTTVTTAPATARNGLDGYAAVTFSVTPSSQSVKKFCGLLASSASQQATGLMNRTDIGGYDGMIFPFAKETSAAFYMANVPVALSVAWFDADGKFVSSADMEPCKTEASKCALYKADKPYRTAIETLKGGLGGIGIGSGSSLSVGVAGPC